MDPPPPSELGPHGGYATRVADAYCTELLLAEVSGAPLPTTFCELLEQLQAHAEPLQAAHGVSIAAAGDRSVTLEWSAPNGVAGPARRGSAPVQLGFRHVIARAGATYTLRADLRVWEELPAAGARAGAGSAFWHGETRCPLPALEPGEWTRAEVEWTQGEAVDEAIGVGARVTAPCTHCNGDRYGATVVALLPDDVDGDKCEVEWHNGDKKDTVKAVSDLVKIPSDGFGPADPEWGRLEWKLDFGDHASGAGSVEIANLAVFRHCALPQSEEEMFADIDAMVGDLDDLVGLGDMKPTCMRAHHMGQLKQDGTLFMSEADKTAGGGRIDFDMDGGKLVDLEGQRDHRDRNAPSVASRHFPLGRDALHASRAGGPSSPSAKGAAGELKSALSERGAVAAMAADASEELAADATTMADMAAKFANSVN